MVDFPGKREINLEEVAGLKRNFQWIFSQMLAGLIKKSELPVQRSIPPDFAFYPLLNLLLKLKDKQIQNELSASFYVERKLPHPSGEVEHSVIGKLGKIRLDSRT